MNIVKSTQRSSFRSAAFATLVCLVGAAQALAGERSVTVSYRDLDLSTLAGATRLYQRISGAARSACGERGHSLFDQGVWIQCYQGAIADAVAKVNSPLLSAVHGSNQPAVTAMNTK